MTKAKLFATEAELVAKFSELVADECSEQRWRTNPAHRPRWTLYHETSGWDVLLAHENGAQIGIEAKLSLNPKVLVQALPGRWAEQRGPDFRAVLVPADGLQHYTDTLAQHLGIVVISVGGRPGFNGKQVFSYHPSLPDVCGSMWQLSGWPNWLPAQRCELPDYVPDVTGGHAAPVALTDWKIRAIKLLIVLERRGYVTRQDMKVLGISHSRWTDNWHGFLTRSEDGYVRCDRTPDLKVQHPTNWAQIEADYETWAKALETAGKLNLKASAA